MRTRRHGAIGRARSKMKPQVIKLLHYDFILHGGAKSLSKEQKKLLLHASRLANEYEEVRRWVKGMEEEKFFCEECAAEELVFVRNDWTRFAFNDEQYAWVYECQNCHQETVVSQPLT